MPIHVLLAFPCLMRQHPYLPSHSMPTILLSSSPPIMLFTRFLRLSLFSNGVLVPNSTSPSLKACGLVCGAAGWTPPVALEWSSDKLKVLGVFVGPGDLEDANWRPRLDAVANVLSSWRQRTLYYGGRALVVNTLALSRFWYVASLVPVPDWVYAELLKLIFNFFWGGASRISSLGQLSSSLPSRAVFPLWTPVSKSLRFSCSGCGNWLFLQAPGFPSSPTGVLSIWVSP